MGELDNSYQKRTISSRMAEYDKKFGVTPTIKEPAPTMKEPPPVPIPKEQVPDEDGGFIASVGEFLKELPEQFLSGVGDAVNNTMETAKDLGKAVGIPDVGIQLTNKKGEFDPGFYGTEDSKEGRSAKVIPVADEADTMAGGMVRSLTEFATGFIPAAKGLGAAGMAAGAVKTTLASGLSSAVAADPHGERLSTLLNQVPALNKIIPDYMADNNPENESVWEGRIKNALDMSMGAAASEGVAAAAGKMFKMYKAGRIAKTAEKATPLDPKAAIKQAEEAMNVADDAARIVAPVENVAPEELLVKEGNKVYLNHARINTEADVKKVLQNAADASIDPKAGAKTFEGIKTASAEEMTSMKELLGRDITRPFTAEEAVASREILNASAENLTKLAKATQGPQATPEALYEFRKALAAHNDIQEVVFAGRKATAQSLASWKIGAGSPEARGLQISRMLKGQEGSIDDMAKVLLEADPSAVSKVAGQLVDPKWRDAAYQVWINGILSGPATHAANIVSNMGTTIGAVGEKYIAAGFDVVSGRGGQGIAEANAKAFGFFSGLKDSFKFIKGADDMFAAGSKLEQTARESAITHKLIGAEQDSFMGKAINYMGKAIDLPGEALQKGDNLFKGINYRMQLWEEATIQAGAEGLTGKAMKKRIAELVANPTEPMKNVAADFASVQTFTNQGGKMIQGMQSLTATAPGVRYVLPFVRTPGNIFKYGFERTPLALGFAETRKALQAGGSARSMALAKMTAGSTIMAGAAAHVLDGTLTGNGPTNAKERATLMATGWQPYSVKVGDKYVSYARLEPIGSLMGYAADVASMMGSDDLTDEERENLVATGLAAFSRSFSQKTFVSGAASFLTALSSGQPGMITNWIQNQASTLVPFSGLGKTVTRYTDDVKKDFKPDDEMGFLRATVEKMKESTGILSADAPPLRDIWGNEMSWSNGIVNSLSVVSPIRVSDIKNDPTTKLVVDRGLSIGRPGRTMDGVKLTNKEYSEYSRLVGKRMKHEMDMLLSKGSMDGFNNEQVQYLVDHLYDKVRSAAKSHFMKGNLDLRERIRDAKQDAINKLKGNN